LRSFQSWKPGTNSLHTIEFGGRPISGGGQQPSACLDVMLRRPKFSKVTKRALLIAVFIL